jgi:hypothetical protein
VSLHDEIEIGDTIGLVGVVPTFAGPDLLIVHGINSTVEEIHQSFG